MSTVAFCKCEGMLTKIHHSRKRACFYYSAPDPKCFSKVVELPNKNSNYSGNYKWFCEQNNTTYSSYWPRYALRFTIENCYGSMNVICFDAVAKKLIGVQATVADQHFRNSNWEAYFGLFRHLYFRNYEFLLRCKPKILNVYNSKHVQTEQVVIEYYCENFRIVDSCKPLQELLLDIKSLNLIRCDLKSTNKQGDKKEANVNDELMCG